MVNHEPVAPEIVEILEEDLMPESSTYMLPLEEDIAAGKNDKKVEADQEEQNDLGLIRQVPEISPEIYPGTGRFVGEAAAPIRRQSLTKPKDEITLNFKSTDIRDLAKVLLGDVLKKNYVIDPNVTGTVNIQTNRPFSRDNVLTLLDDILQMHGATLIESGDLVKIQSISASDISLLPPRLNQALGSDLTGAYTQIVPLQYIGAQEIHKILQPFLKNAIAHVYPERNLLMLSGTATDLNRLISTVQMFDVDWLAGMSLAMVPLQHSEATDVVQELDSLFGQASNSPLASVIRFMPLARLNSVIVITQQPRYLKEMTQWINRLDRSDGIEGYQLYVYPVQNKRAEELAAVLNNIFNNQRSNTAVESPYAQLAPGLQPTTLGYADPNSGVQQTAPDRGELADPSRQSNQAMPLAETRGSNVIPNSADGVNLPGPDSVRIIADETDNSLVILASPYDYEMVERAIRKLDTKPLQVLIEASIVEVTLRDELRYGLDWFFKNNSGIGNKTGIARLQLGSSIAPNAGFSYGIVDAAGAFRAVFNSLATESKINVISSPSLMVLDNHTASINIGDQVPILTSQSTSNLTDNSVTVNQVEYRDTGVIMTVTPRVNSSGLIVLDITQEVTDVARTVTSGIDAPTFQRRSIESTISVDNGNSIVLGGLIRDQRDGGEEGIPVLHKAPIVGPLFGSKSNLLRRTELVVILTPRAILEPGDAFEISNEFKQRLKTLRTTIQEQ